MSRILWTEGSVGKGGQLRLAGRGLELHRSKNQTIAVKRRGRKGVCTPTIMINISSSIATLSIEVAVQGDDGEALMHHLLVVLPSSSGGDRAQVR